MKQTKSIHFAWPQYHLTQELEFVSILSSYNMSYINLGTKSRPANETSSLSSRSLYSSEKVKVAQSCPTLCNPMDYTVHGILQARILEWVAFPLSRESSQPRDRAQVSCIAGGCFTTWATREASKKNKLQKDIAWIKPFKEVEVAREVNGRGGHSWGKHKKNYFLKNV